MPTTTAGAPEIPNLSQERLDLLGVLANARHFLRYPARELSDAQASTHTTESELTIGGLIKHVSSIEAMWQSFMVEGKAAFPGGGDMDWESIPPEAVEAFKDEFRMVEGDTLEGLLKRYAEVAERTDQLVQDLDLDQVFELPNAPWFVEKSWSVRRVVLHIAAETAQHSGHADIIRESLDGAKSMA